MLLQAHYFLTEHTLSAPTKNTHTAAWIRIHSGIGVFLQFSDDIFHYFLMHTTEITNYMFLIHGDEFVGSKMMGALNIFKYIFL